MKISAPKTHTVLAHAIAGKEFGHVPGHKYNDVHCIVSRSRTGRYICQVTHVTGSSQGVNRDEEHTRNEEFGEGDTIQAACTYAAMYVLHNGKIPRMYSTPAIVEAQATAEDVEAKQVTA